VFYIASYGAVCFAADLNNPTKENCHLNDEIDLDITEVHDSFNMNYLCGAKLNMSSKEKAFINRNIVPDVTFCTFLSELSSPLTVGPALKRSPPLSIMEKCIVVWLFSEPCVQVV